MAHKIYIATCLLFIGLILGIIYAPGLIDINWPIILEFMKVLLSWPPVTAFMLLTVLFIFRPGLADLFEVISGRLKALRNLKTPYGDLDFGQEADAKTPSQPAQTVTTTTTPLVAAPAPSPQIHGATNGIPLEPVFARSSLYVLVSALIMTLSHERKKSIKIGDLNGAIPELKGNGSYLWGALSGLHACNLFNMKGTVGGAWITESVTEGLTSEVIEQKIMEEISRKYGVERKNDVSDEDAGKYIDEFMTIVAGIKAYFLKPATEKSATSPSTTDQN